jgi:hypothetical protein
MGPSWVDGQSQGQCAGFSTTTTSIATPVAPTPYANLATLPASGFPVPKHGDHVRRPPDLDLAALYCRSAASSRATPIRASARLTSASTKMTSGSQCRLIGTDASFSTAAVAPEGLPPNPTGSTNADPVFGQDNGYAVAAEDGRHLDTELALPTCDSGFGNSNEFLP